MRLQKFNVNFKKNLMNQLVNEKVNLVINELTINEIVPISDTVYMIYSDSVCIKGSLPKPFSKIISWPRS